MTTDKHVMWCPLKQNTVCMKESCMWYTAGDCVVVEIATSLKGINDGLKEIGNAAFPILAKGNAQRMWREKNNTGGSESDEI